jgi:hypothetical protein
MRLLRGLCVGFVLALILGAWTAATAIARRGQERRGAAPTAVAVKVALGRGPEIPSGFLGLSLEYTAIEPYAGADPKSVNPVFEQLVRNLGGNQHLVLRIGGDSTDWTWWPVPGMARPPGVRITLTPSWVAVTQALVRDLSARVILGINFEADDVRLAAAEARALVHGLGARSIEAFELGNEPELYHSFGWYRTSTGAEVPGRPAGYGFPMFAREFASIAGALPRVDLAGPATGASRWLEDWDAFLRGEPRVRMATVHRYGLHDCTTGARSAGYPTPRHLLGPVASVQPAMTVRPFVRIAHAHRVQLRVDEMNSTPCYNVSPVAARSFASALWSLDALFELASVGVDGVNVHTYPGAPYGLFEFAAHRGRWQATVSAEYYGLMMFARAAPPGSRLLRVTVTPGSAVRAWATAGADHVRRLVLINNGGRPRVVTVKGLGSAGRTSAEALRAPGIESPYGVTLDGQTFGRVTSSGLLSGPRRGWPVRQLADELVARVPATSAVLVTVG